MKKLRIFFSLLTVIAVIIAGALIPMPYVIERPGPTYNVLAKTENSQELIQVKNTKTYPVSGNLRMVTVGVQGSPENQISLWDYLFAYLDEEAEVVSLSKVYPDNISEKEIERITTRQMKNSQLASSVASWKELGHKVPGKTEVVEIDKTSSAHGILQAKDIIKSISYKGKKTQLDQADSLFKTMAEIPANSEVELEISRGTELKKVSLKTKAAPHKKGSLLGIYVDTHPELPFQVDFSLKDVGGPSAGLIFSLGIIEHLTPEKLMGSETIAGTGAIDYSGRVEPISGVPQKIYGASRDGAKWFLLPRSNCNELPENPPIPAIPVETLSEARQVIKQINAGDTKSLPQCSSDKGSK